MFKELIENKHTIFYKEANDWKEAIKLSCIPLIETGYCTDEYVSLIIKCVEELGPYIVLVPGLAMPHSTVSAQGVNKSAISFAQFEKPVVFHDKETGEDKTANSFFVLCAKEPNEHMENMRKLFTILSDENILNEVFKAKTNEDLLKIDELIHED